MEVLELLALNEIHLKDMTKIEIVNKKNKKNKKNFPLQREVVDKPKRNFREYRYASPLSAHLEPASEERSILQSAILGVIIFN